MQHLPPLFPGQRGFVDKVELLAVGGRVARHGRADGQLTALGAGRSQRLVPLHAIPRRWAGKTLGWCPRGDCVARMPCGAWG